MSGPDFFQTRMGQKFFDDTMPKLVDYLGCLNKTLETTAGRLNTTLEAIAAMLRNDCDAHVAAGERGYRFHRHHRAPGTHPVEPGQFFACAD